jgi:hypothetical protein
LGALVGIVFVETILKLTAIRRARKAQGRGFGVIPHRRTVRREHRFRGCLRRLRCKSKDS